MPTGQQIGYIRVSSADQNPDRQLQDIQLDKRFIEKQSGKSIKDRLVWIECSNYLRDGDTLHVHSLDRLGRSLSDLKKIIDSLTEKQVVVKSHKENLLFDKHSSDPMTTLLFHIFGAFAEFERSLIRERQREGIDAAKRRGKHLGRPTKLTDSEDLVLMGNMFDRGDSVAQVAKHFGVSRALIYNRKTDFF